MSVVVPVSANCREIVPRPSNDPIAPLIADGHRPTLTGRRVPNRLLVVAIVAITLGLGAVMASLASFASDRGDAAQPRPPMVIDRSHAPRLSPSRDGPVWPPADEVNPAALLWGSTSSLWSSSLQPPTDATTEAGLAHVGTAASSRDPRAFLMDAAIQIHAPASAPAPRRRSAPPHPHGVD